MICVVIGRSRHKMMQIEIEEAAKRGAQMIELRLDFLAKAPDFKQILDNKPCPMVATVRRQEDGGRWAGREDERRILLRQATVAGFDWIDVETDAADDIRRFKDVKRIVSYHNPRETPADLEELYARMCEQDADVVKIVVMAQRLSDNLRVLSLLNNPPKPTVAHCMGDLGFASRFLSVKFGAPFTYAAFNKERGMAPAIPSFDEMKHVYHCDRIDADTRVFGVIGDPIAHSLSPLIHNRAMRKIGYNGLYLPFRVPRSLLPSFLKDFDNIPVHGYSVTIPQKEAAFAVAKIKDGAATLVKAANTLVRTKDSFAAYNTDFQAGIETLRTHLPLAPDGQEANLHLTALILGAGGAARALAFALHREGARVVLSNRTSDRAHQLAEEIGCRYVAWEARHTVPCELVVNCTSVGMYPNVDESPVHYSFFRPGLTVFDTVYNPETTLLIKEARSRGCNVITGVDMFVRQAAMQFRLFTGHDAPLELMREELKRALLPVHWQEEE